MCFSIKMVDFLPIVGGQLWNRPSSSLAIWFLQQASYQIVKFDHYRNIFESIANYLANQSYYLLASPYNN